MCRRNWRSRTTVAAELIRSSISPINHDAADVIFRIGAIYGGSNRERRLPSSGNYAKGAGRRSVSNRDCRGSRAYESPSIIEASKGHGECARCEIFMRPGVSKGLLTRPFSPVDSVRERTRAASHGGYEERMGAGLRLYDQGASALGLASLEKRKENTQKRNDEVAEPHKSPLATRVVRKLAE